MARITRGGALVMAVVIAGCGGGTEPAPEAAAPALAQQQLLSNTPGFGGHGTWWNPAEPGTGFVFEAQGSVGVITFFVYEGSGKPVWYSGAGAFTLQPDGKHAFAATLYRYSGGQAASSATPKTPNRTAVADVGVVFSSDSAQVNLPGRSFTARKFNASTAAGGVQPEAGIYWNAAESGRGYTMEVAGNIASIGVFHYDASGEPTWNLIVGDMSTGRLASSFTSYTGGQTLTGAYKPAQQVTTSQQFQANFASACSGSIQFPGMSAVAVNRFPFGGLSAGAECRSASLAANCTAGVVQGYARNIEQFAADAGFAGGDGGVGGDGGGAAAGGGLGKVLGGLMRVQDLSDGSTVGEAITDGSQGLVTVKTCGRAGPFLLTLEGRQGAKYFDEGLNQLSDFGPGNVLHALVDKWDEHVGVSPLTEAAYRYALNNFKQNPASVAAGQLPLLRSGDLRGITRDQVAQANARTLAVINFTLNDSVKLPSVNALPTPVDAGSSAATLTTTRYGLSAVVNGGLVVSAHKYAPGASAPALEAAQFLGDDLSDGVLNGFSLDGRPVRAQGAVAVEPTRFPIAAAVGQASVASRFGSAVFHGAPTFSEFMSSNMGVQGDTDLLGLRKDGSLVISRDRTVIENFLQNINQISWGFHASFAMGGDGAVYAWGNQACGRIGNGQVSDALVTAPFRVPNLTNIKAIANNNIATYALDASGNVYSWGGDLHGLLGRGSNAANEHCSDGNAYMANPVPARIPTLSNIRDLSTGQLSAYAITNDGRIYEWGSVAYAGVYQPVSTPREVPGLSGVVQLASNGGEAVALAADGKLYGWGGGGAVSTVLGQPRDSLVPTPRMIPGFEQDRVVQVAGDSGSAYIVLLATGEIKFWNSSSVLVPRKVDAGRALMVTYGKNQFGSTIEHKSVGTLPAIRQISRSLFGVMLYGVDGSIYEATHSFTATGGQDLQFFPVNNADLQSHLAGRRQFRGNF